MSYSRTQKFISGLVIFALLGATTFEIPLLQFLTYASGDEFYNIVSILVEEEKYNEIKTEVKRYAQDIQGVLENTKTIILPTPKNSSAFEVASMLEALYFEGYKGLKDVDFESKLIGTVFVGDISIPQVYVDDNYEKTIVPYTDFIDKKYIYNRETNRYEENTDNIDGVKSEIWHGFISPNEGSESDNITAIKDYFDKNHDFYSGDGNFDSNEFMNGNTETGVHDDYEPYVFYFDNYREKSGFNYDSYKSYLAYLDNKEDIVYNRFTKELAQEISDYLLGEESETVSELIAKVDSDFDPSEFSSSMDLFETPDIQTRSIIEETTNYFLGSFSQGTISDFRANVHNAGRYNSGATEVNVDMVPYLISVLDIVNDQVIKNSNDLLEEKIDEIVINDLQSDIYVPIEITYGDYSLTTSQTNSVEPAPGTPIINYTNILYGTQMSDIIEAEQCSIFRGESYYGKLVEANRAYNYDLIEGDIETLKKGGTSCLEGITDKSSFLGWWSGHTPINSTFDSFPPQLGKNNYLKSIVPLFDIEGSIDVSDRIDVYPAKPILDNAHSYLDCQKTNFLKTQQLDPVVVEGSEGTFELIYQAPIEGNSIKNWSCKTDNKILEYTTTYKELLLETRIYNIETSIPVGDSSADFMVYVLEQQGEEDSDLDISDYVLGEIGNDITVDIMNFVMGEASDDIEDGNISLSSDESGTYTVINVTEPKCYGYVCIDGDYKITYDYVPSYVMHKSPTYEELDSQMENMISPDLPVDKNRYIDFQNKSINYQKINYPYLFRLGVDGDEDLTIENIKSTLEATLSSYDPILGQSLYDYLDSQDTKNGDPTKGSYLDNLTFALYWNNLSISSKYKFVFENYLTDQLGGNGHEFGLFNNREQYEIAYLGADGDAQNMYVLLDPESESDENPYTSTIADNQALQNSLLLSNTDTESGETTFKCAPPEGVVLWEWFPAIICRLQDMLPPTISINTDSCSSTELSAEDLEFILENGGDEDQNGIIDCIEMKIAKASLELDSDSSKYYYGTQGILTSKIKDENENVVNIDSVTKVNFELVKVEVKENEDEELTDGNKKDIYNKYSLGNLSNEEALSEAKKYINFENGEIVAQNGIAQKSFVAKYKDADITFESSYEIKDYNGDVKYSEESEKFTIQIRGDRLFVNSYKILEDKTIDFGLSSVVASDKNNIYISQNDNFVQDSMNSLEAKSSSKEKLLLNLLNYNDTTKVEIEYPITVEIYNDDDELYIDELSINSIDDFVSLGAFSEAGEYTFVITDAYGFSIKKDIQVLADVASRLEIGEGSTVIQTGGNTTSNLISLYDQYDNITTGTFYQIEAEINGNGIVFDNEGNTMQNYSLFEGYKVFSLFSTDNQDNNKVKFSVKDTSGKFLFDDDVEIETLNNINVSLVKNFSDIELLGGPYSYNLSLTDSSGQVLDGFNSRVYFNIPSIYGESSKEYFDVVNGKASVEFTTKNISSKDIQVEFQVEGYPEIIKRYITINPGDPLYMDLYTSSDNIEADGESTSTVRVELKDRYGNLVFTDSSTQVELEILEEYERIITSNDKVDTFDGGKAYFAIKSTEQPGVGYFKVSTTPSLNSNSFIIEDNSTTDSGDLIINGIGETVGQITTSYFWNKEDIEGKTYTALYTTLLGANYGDISQKDYLAGALLFEKDNRALGVTSLLNIPYDTNDVLSIDENGKTATIYDSSDLSQDIALYTTLVDDKISLDIYNEALDTYIGNIYYDFGDDNLLLLCDDLESCSIEEEDQTSIFFEGISQDYTYKNDTNKIVVYNDDDNKVFEISEDGKLSKYGNININLNDEYSSYNVFNIEIDGEIIGIMGFNFIDSKTYISRNESVYNSTKSNLDNNILVYLYSDLYLYNSSENKKIIYYNDPFETNISIRDYAGDDDYGYENFVNEEGLGWKDGNKILLEFASGESIGESVKNYMSFSVINLGDPVVSLKTIKKSERKFDSTIGQLISKNDDLVSYEVFDYNGDEFDDLLLIKQDGFLELLENKDIAGDFLNKGNVAHIVDMGNEELIKTGDFTGDGYDDIFFVDNEGGAFLLNNTEKDFVRKDFADLFNLDSSDMGSDSLDNVFSFLDEYLTGGLNLEGQIIQSDVFDMDNDGIDDIVIFDDSGTISIFYGGGTSEEPFFTKKVVVEDLGLVLSTDVRSDNGLIYFDGLYQLPVDGDNTVLLENNSKYLDDYEKGDISASSSEDLIDELLFKNLTYSIEGDNGSSDFDLWNYVTDESGDLEGSSVYEIFGYMEDELSEEEPTYELDDFIGIDAIDEDDLVSGQYEYAEAFTTDYVTFIKSEYSEVAGVKVEKIYEDLNGDTLKGGDKIKVTIELTNVSSSQINSIAYAESLDTIFTIDSESIATSTGAQIDFDVPLTTFLIDDFNLGTGETFIIEYEANTKDFIYGSINVGLFEDDDLFGDIIFSADSENCSQTVDIFRSVAEREYEQGTKIPECNENKIVLPDGISDNALDENGNGIPDYIDELTEGSTSGDTSALEAYADEQLSSINDSSKYDDSGTDIDNIYSSLEDVENFINGLSCGFGDASCIATPLNWAPLAPGGDPTWNGYPIGDGFNVDEGIPVFSALTGLQTTCGNSPCCIPTVWPVSSKMYIPGPACGPNGAGGELGVYSPTNQVRIFVTPTLTGGMGTAVCFGGPAAVVGNAPSPGISPIITGGNCIVTAQPLALCDGDGSDGDVASTGFSTVDTGDYQVLNGNCNEGSKEITDEYYLEDEFVEDYYSYKKYNDPSDYDDEILSVYQSISEATSTSTMQITDEPLITIGNGTSGGYEANVDININNLVAGDFSDIIEIEQHRNSSFPAFLMDWVTRQIEEIVNKLTDFPTLFVILPDFTGIFDGDWADVSGNNDDSYDFIKSEKFADEVKQVNSGVKEAYNFLANIPLIKLEQEVVNINFPWIDRKSLDKYIDSRGKTVDERKKELGEFSDSVSLGATCNQDNAEEKQACEEANSINNKIFIDAQALISSLEANIEVLEDYKAMPEKIYDWLNVKEKYLQQILCNIENISKLIGGRIGDNGERFKAWVHLYILIKAVLKSWQGLIDIFIDYEAECHECKNERQDLQTFIWGLIDMIIPEIPVIQFPKWPDIILDLHNIRAGLTISLPEIHVNNRPIVLPYLPDLNLPRLPNVNINLPSLPVLPTIELPELPDLPTLPTVELPNLPPPPKLPSLIAELQGIVDILKLITKLMCILKMSPFVPEWRAGDQIAFLTERQGYLGFDFALNISYPQFSFPFVDAIKVTSYVNLEFDTDFIVELTRQTASPINNFTNNIVHLFDLSIQDIDLSESVPDDVNINVGTDGSVGLNALEVLAVVLIKNINKLHSYIADNNEDMISVDEFHERINEQLASENFISDPRTKQIQNIWKQINNYTYSKEDELINELKETNKEKFDLLKDIINTEIIDNNKFIKEYNQQLNQDYITKVSYNENNKIDHYNEQLDIYNDKFVNSLNDLVTNNTNKEYKDELKNIGTKVLNNVNNGLISYAEGLNNNLLAAKTDTSAKESSTQTACQLQADSDYKYSYEGIYIVDGDISYRLFDYLDELNGDEEITEIDYDKDGDDDLLYMVNGELFLKENLSEKEDKNYVSDSPIVLDSDDNKFLSGEIFYEAVNNFKSTVSEFNHINLSFDHSTLSDINAYRIELYNIVDKFINEENSDYTPEDLKKSVIDAFSSIDDITLLDSDNELYELSSNLGYIKNVGNLSGIRLETYEFDNIKDDIIDNNFVNVKQNSIIYTSGNDVTIKYYDANDKEKAEEKTLSIEAYSNIKLNSSIVISTINADAYINTDEMVTIDGEDIREYIGMPLLPDTKISIIEEATNSSLPRYIDIEYYDGAELDINFEEISSYYLYDLGYKQTDTYIRIEEETDYYYAKIRAFKEDTLGTLSNQILIYPQLDADTSAPELNYSGDILIPVYQKKTIDFSDYIYEESGISSIENIYIDFDLDVDSDLDGDTTNDNDTDKITYDISYDKIRIEFGEYDELFTKKIGVSILDRNGNVGYKELTLTVYSPIPNIEDYSNNIISGYIDEELSEEPVNFYRYRGGMLVKLEDINGYLTGATNEKGAFEFELNNENEENGLYIEQGDSVLAYINEYSGKISKQNASVDIKVLSSNDNNNDLVYPKIILTKGGDDIYYQYIVSNEDKAIELVNDFDNIEADGIYVKFINRTSYNSYILSDATTYDAGSLFIYRNTDNDKEALFTIFKDGRVNTKDSSYSLEYFSYGVNIGYKLMDNNIEVAELLFKIDGEYVIK